MDDQEDDAGEVRYELDAGERDRGVITTSNDVPVRTLLAEIAARTLIVTPLFQRENVWGRDRQSKLIESLLLNVPIPMLYFAEDDDGTKVVVDGQQRLRAIDDFYLGRYGLKRLDVLPDMNGKRWADLTPKQSETILNGTLRCVLIAAASPATIRFEMFERLSTGGMPLNDQELRNCVFRGPLNDLLHDLVRTAPWLAAVGKPTPELRMRHEELALRFFTLRAVTANYRPPLKQVMNEFMRANRTLDEPGLFAMAATFERALTNCVAVFGEHCFRRLVQAKGRPERWETNLNRAVFDVQMLCLADLPAQLVHENIEVFRDTFRAQSLGNPDFQAAVSLATAGRAPFYARLRGWLTALQDAGIASPLLHRLPHR